MNKIKVINLTNGKIEEVNPLYPEVKRTYKYRCIKCGMTTNTYERTKIFNLYSDIGLMEKAKCYFCGMDALRNPQ